VTGACWPEVDMTVPVVDTAGAQPAREAETPGQRCFVGPACLFSPPASERAATSAVPLELVIAQTPGLQQVLSNKQALPSERTQALSLRERNIKDWWRLWTKILLLASQRRTRSPAGSPQSPTTIHGSTPIDFLCCCGTIAGAVPIHTARLASALSACHGACQGLRISLASAPGSA
jgi:hypothetical protein